MRTLNTPEELLRAEGAAREVFQSFDAGTSQPFRASIEARLLVYPIDYTMLTPEQFGALTVAAAAVGDATAYLAAFGPPDAGWQGIHEHCLVALDDFLEYRSKPDALILEHLLYSPRGTWGLVTSDGEYAAVGGSQSFVDTLRRHLPEQETEAVKALIRDSREAGRDDDHVERWLRPLVGHVYGENRAMNLWEDG